jgi:hypothetical protein
MKKQKEKHPTIKKPDDSKTSSNAQRQGLDRDTAQRQQRDNMLTDTNATQSSEASSGASEPASGGRRSQSTPDTSDTGRRSSVESPDPGSGDVDHHSGSGRDTMGTGGRGQG